MSPSSSFCITPYSTDLNLGKTERTLTFSCVSPFVCAVFNSRYGLPETPLDCRVPAGTKLPQMTSHGKIRLGTNNMEFLPDIGVKTSLANSH